MRALEFIADVDEQHRLHLELPDEAAEAEGELEAVWMRAIAHEWREDLADPREDIYTLEDGEPIDAVR